MTIGLIDNRISYQHLPDRQRAGQRPSHGDRSLEILLEAHDEQAHNSLAFEHLGLISMPDSQDMLLNLLKGVDQLISQQVRVICLPMGFAKPTPLLESIAKACNDKGILLIAPAGNNGPGKIRYPGGYPEVLCIGAADHLGDLATFSGSLNNEEGHCIKPEILAEGMFLPASSDQHRLITKGTSIACARVAGLAAAMLGVNPELDAQELKKLLYESCNATRGSRYGLMDAKKAMRLAENSTTIQRYKPTAVDQNLNQKWIDQRLRSQCERASDLGRMVQGLVASATREKLDQLVQTSTTEEIRTCTKFAYFNVAHIEAEPTFFEKLLVHPDLAWASAVDVNYFDL